MSFIKAKEHLKKYNLEQNIIEFNISSATVELAASLLNCKNADIAKTMAFQVVDKAILIVTAGDQKIDNSKYKGTFHTKAKMIPSSYVENIIGHEIGGVCPFGINQSIEVYLDESLKNHQIIYPACGSHTSAVKLTLEELEKSSEFKEWVDVCKPIEK